MSRSTTTTTAGVGNSKHQQWFARGHDQIITQKPRCRDATAVPALARACSAYLAYQESAAGTRPLNIVGIIVATTAAVYINWQLHQAAGSRQHIYSSRKQPCSMHNVASLVDL
jgi:hypothetical protein